MIHVTRKKKNRGLKKRWLIRTSIGGHSDKRFILSIYTSVRVHYSSKLPRDAGELSQSVAKPKEILL